MQNRKEDAKSSADSGVSPKRQRRDRDIEGSSASDDNDIDQPQVTTPVADSYRPPVILPSRLDLAPTSYSIEPYQTQATTFAAEYCRPPVILPSRGISSSTSYPIDPPPAYQMIDINPSTVLPARPQAATLSRIIPAPTSYPTETPLRRNRQPPLMQCRYRIPVPGTQEVQTHDIVVPTTFDDDVVLSSDLQTPTPLQRLGWGVLLSQRDLLCVAESGTERSLTFVIPAIAAIERRRRMNAVLRGPAVIVLTADEAWATAVHVDMQRYAPRWMTAVLCINAFEPVDPDRLILMYQLSLHPGMLVGTVDAILNLERQRHLLLEDLSMLVVDGLDTMTPEVRAGVRRMIDLTGNSRRVVTSLTREDWVQQFAISNMEGPVLVDAGNIGAVPLMLVDGLTELLGHIRVENEGNMAQPPDAMNVWGGNIADRQ